MARGQRRKAVDQRRRVELSAASCAPTLDGGRPTHVGVIGEANIPTEEPPAGEEARLPASDVDPGGTGDPAVASPKRPPQAFRLIGRLAEPPLIEAPDRVHRRPGHLRRLASVTAAGATRPDHGNLRR